MLSFLWSAWKTCECFFFFNLLFPIENYLLKHCFIIISCFELNVMPYEQQSKERKHPTPSSPLAVSVLSTLDSFHHNLSPLPKLFIFSSRLYLLVPSLIVPRWCPPHAHSWCVSLLPSFSNLGDNLFPELPHHGLEGVSSIKVHNNRHLRVFPGPESFPNVQILALSYAYHCCPFLRWASCILNTALLLAVCTIIKSMM